MKKKEILERGGTNSLGVGNKIGNFLEEREGLYRWSKAIVRFGGGLERKKKHLYLVFFQSEGKTEGES